MPQNWVKIFDSKEEATERVPEDIPRLLVVQGVRICLINRNGRFHAVQDACPHNGEMLSKGIVNYLGEVVCPWHNYQFDLETGRECKLRTPDLQVYPIEVLDTGIYIGL